MCSRATDQGRERSGNESHNGAGLVYIENLADLRPHTEDIVGKFNGDKEIGLLALVDPVGVLGEFGYELSPGAARKLRRALPRFTRAERDRYLAWLRDQDPIPDTIDIKLVHRPSGRDLLQRSTQPENSAGNSGPSPGAGAADSGSGAAFDITAQFGEGLCERMLQRHYADGRLPRSVYRIGGKLYYFRNSGEYESFRKSIGDADREVHFGEPSLAFSAAKPDRARVSSPFIADGFQSKPVKGSVGVDAKLVLRKDAQGHPQYVEVSFDGLSDTDVALSTTAGGGTPAQLKQMVHSAYKDFRQLSKPTEPHAPLTFTLIDSTALPTKGIKPGEAKFAVMKPAGAPSPLLIVGFNRAERKGSGTLATVANHIKPGGDYALLQDAGWLEQKMNKAYAGNLPLRYDPDSGKPAEDGDLRIDSLVWHYREGGITGNYSATYENAVLWVDVNQKGEIRIDMTFHSSDPSLTLVGSSGAEDLHCYEKLMLWMLYIIVFMVVGAFFGGAIGGVVGAFVGAMVGLGAGIAAGVYMGLDDLFDPSGMTPSQTQPLKQEIKLTYEESLPEVSESVKVVPNDYKVSGSGTAMSAKVVGPAAATVEPWVRMAGSYSVDVQPPQPSAASTPVPSGAGPEGPGGAELVTTAGGADRLVDSSATWAAGQAGMGTISLHYYVDYTYGLQGTLAYDWTFNKKAIGSSEKVDLDLPLDAQTLASLEYNKVNMLGVLKVTVTDAFGRTASDSVKMMVGTAKDLRAFRPLTPRMPGELEQIIDPYEQLAVKRPGELFHHVGWQQEGNPMVQSEGVQIGYTTFASPLSGETLVVVATAPQTMI